MPFLLFLVEFSSLFHHKGLTELEIGQQSHPGKPASGPGRLTGLFVKVFSNDVKLHVFADFEGEKTSQQCEQLPLGQELNSSKQRSNRAF
jgi:hypothetical protein